MEAYLVWNLKQQAWRMNELIGFTDECEFAGVFTESYLIHNTGMFDERTGDYSNNILVSASTLAINDFNKRMINLSSSVKNALKKAITKELKRRTMPVEIDFINNKRYCPYCKKQLLRVISKDGKKYCNKCLKPVKLELEVW